MKIAIVGSGISGSLAARLLSTVHEVSLFEANSTPGGHTNTVDVEVFGRSWSVDTAFMVFNRRTYPNFCRLLEILEVESRPSDMSFSVRSSRTGLEYQGSSLNGLFAQRRNLCRGSFLRMLREISRFNRIATKAIATDKLKEGQSVGNFLKTYRFGTRFSEDYLVPMAAAIWSAKPRAIFDFPATFMLGFFANHGLLQLRDRPQWRTICGGARNYLNALLSPIRDAVRVNCRVQSVTRTVDGVCLTPENGLPEFFDEVVFATHADQTLRMLVDVTAEEQSILECFPYQSSEAVLHTDQSLLPQRRRAWASWNYHIPRSETEAASVTYDLSRLQGLDTPRPLLLTLNETSRIDRTKILRTFHYQHPAFSSASLAAQRRFDEINGKNRTHYCGAYWGYGFHEDGVNSALAVARKFGIGLESCKVVSTKERSGTVATSL